MKFWVVLVVGFLVATIDCNPANAADVNIDASGPTVSIIGGEAGVIGTQGRRTNPVAKAHPHVEKRVKHPAHPAPSSSDTLIKAITTFLEPIVKFIKHLLASPIAKSITKVIVSFLEIEIIKTIISFVKSLIGGILGYFKGILFPVGKSEGGTGIMADVFSTLVSFVVNLIKSLVELYEKPIGILETLFKPLVEGVEKLIGGSLKSVGSSIHKYLTDFFTDPLHVLKTLLKTIELNFGIVVLSIILLVGGVPLVLMLISFLLKGVFKLLVFVFSTSISILGLVFSTFFGGFTFVIYVFSTLLRIVRSTFLTVYGLATIGVTIITVSFNVLSFLLHPLTSVFSAVLKALITPFNIIFFLLGFIESILNTLMGLVFDFNNFIVGLISGLRKLFWNLLLPVPFVVNIGGVIFSVIFNIIKFVLLAPLNLLRGPAAFSNSCTELLTNITSLVLKLLYIFLDPICTVIKYLLLLLKAITTAVFKAGLVILSYVLQAIVVLLGKLGEAVLSTITLPFKRLGEVVSAFVGEIVHLAISATSLNDFFYKLPASVLKHRDHVVTSVSSLVGNFSSLLRGGLSKLFSVLSSGVWPLIKKIASFLLTAMKEVLLAVLTLLSNVSITELFNPLAAPFKTFHSGFTCKAAFNEIVEILSKGLKFNILSELQKMWSSESEYILKSFRKLFGELRKMAFHQSHNLTGVLKTLQGTLLKIIQLAYAIIKDSLSPALIPFGKLSTTVLEFLHALVKFIVSKIPVKQWTCFRQS